MAVEPKTTPKTKTRAPRAAKASTKPTAKAAETAPKAEKVAAKEPAAPEVKAAPVEKIEEAAAKTVAAPETTPMTAAEAVDKTTAPAIKAVTPKIAEAVAKPSEPKAKPAPVDVKRTSTASNGNKKVASAKAETSAMKTTVNNVTQESKKMAEAATEKMKSMMSEFTTKAKEGFEKATSMMGEANEFTKGNMEALVESGKIYTKGAQELGQSMVEEARKSFEESTKAMKDFAAVKSPTEFFQLQSELARKSFDTMVAQSSKQSESMIKLMGDTFQPISNRMSLAVEKVKAAAA